LVKLLYNVIWERGNVKKCPFVTGRSLIRICFQLFLPLLLCLSRGFDRFDWYFYRATHYIGVQFVPINQWKCCMYFCLFVLAFIRHTFVDCQNDWKTSSMPCNLIVFPSNRITFSGALSIKMHFRPMSSYISKTIGTVIMEQVYRTHNYATYRTAPRPMTLGYFEGHFS